MVVCSCTYKNANLMQVELMMLVACCAAARQLAAQIRAHDETRVQRMAAAAAKRRRCRIRRAVTMGAVAGASLLLAAVWRGAPKQQRGEAAAAPRPAAGQRAVAWSFMSDPMTNTLTGVKFEFGAAR